MKKVFAALLVLVLMMTTLFSGAALAENKKLSIVTTIFPIYDWVRQIVGEDSSVEITMLLDNGTDLHSYQPTAQDILKVSNADLFIYVGGESDEWVEDVLATAANPKLVAINLVEAMGDAIKAEEIVEGMEHEHEHEEGEEEHEHEHEHEHEEIELEDIQDRPLTDFAGEWKSLQPLLLAGELDAFCEHKAEEDEDESATKETYFAKFAANWACDAVTMKITGDTISFTDENGNTVTGTYSYAGFTPILADDGDVKSVRYQYTSNTDGAPKYVQFNDHGYQVGDAEHFHVYFGNDSFDSMLTASSNPYFVAADLSTAGILQQLMGHNHEGHEHHHDHEEEETDEHVWLSLRNAEALCKVIAEELSKIDAANSDKYQANLVAYCAQLIALDKAYTEMVNAAQYKTVLFGDRFPFRYLTDDYGLTYFAAFSGCSAESEASFQTIVFLAQKVDELNLPAVLTIEHPKTRIAETVVSTSQAKNAKILSMDSMQSITAQDVKAGATYLAIMESNLAVLKEALN